MDKPNLEKNNNEKKPFGKEAIKIQIKTYGRFLEHLDDIRQKNQEQKFYYDIINADYSNGIQGLVDQKNNNAIAAYTLFSGNVAKIADITKQFTYEGNQDRLGHRNTPDANVSDESNLVVEKDYKAVRFDSNQAAHDLIEELAKRAETELRSAEDLLKRLDEPELNHLASHEPVKDNEAVVLRKNTLPEKINSDDSVDHLASHEPVKDKEALVLRKNTLPEKVEFSEDDNLNHLASHEPVKDNEAVVLRSEVSEDPVAKIVEQTNTASAEKAVEIDPALFEDLHNKRERYFKARIMRGRIASRTIGKLFGRFLKGDNGEKMFFGGTEGKINLEKLEREYNEALNDLYRARLVAELVRLPDDADSDAVFAKSRELMIDHQRREQNLINKGVESGEFKTGWLDKAHFKLWTNFWRSTSGNVTRALGGGTAAGVAGLSTVVASKYGARKGLLAMFGGATGGILNAVAGMYGTYKLTEAVLERRGPTGMTQRGWVDENFDKVSPEEVKNLDESIVLQEVARLREMQLVRGTKVEDAFVSGILGKSREKRRKLAEALLQRERELRAYKAVDEVWSEDLVKNINGTEQRERIAYLVAHQVLKEMRDRERRSIHETDNERNARIKRKAAAMATGVTVGWLTGGFLPTDLPDDTPDTPPVEGFDPENPPVEDGDPSPDNPPADGDDNFEPVPTPETEAIPDHKPLEVEIVKWVDFDGVSGDLKADTFIEAAGDLQDQIRELEPDQQAFYQELLDMDREELAQKLGGYRPENSDESLIIHPGDKLQLIEGNVQILRADGEVDVLYSVTNGGFSPENLNDEAFMDSLTPKEYYGGGKNSSVFDSGLVANGEVNVEVRDLASADAVLDSMENAEFHESVEYKRALEQWSNLFMAEHDGPSVREYVQLLHDQLKIMSETDSADWSSAQVAALYEIGVIDSVDSFNDLSEDAREQEVIMGLGRAESLMSMITPDLAPDLTPPDLTPPDASELRGVLNSEIMLQQQGDFDKLNQLYQAQLADGKVVGEYGEHLTQRVGLLDDYLAKQQDLVGQIGPDQATGRTLRDLATELRSERDLVDVTQDSVRLESLYEKYDVSDYNELKQAVNTRIEELGKLAEMANNKENLFTLKGLPEPEVKRAG